MDDDTLVRGAHGVHIKNLGLARAARPRLLPLLGSGERNAIREPENEYPPAHLQVHAPEARLCELARPGKQLHDFHFPVGGIRYRPTLEDVNRAGHDRRGERAALATDKSKLGTVKYGRVWEGAR